MTVLLFFMGVVIVDLKADYYHTGFKSFSGIFVIMKKGPDPFLNECIVFPDGLLIFEERKCLEHLGGLSDFENIFVILLFY